MDKPEEMSREAWYTQQSELLKQHQQAYFNGDWEKQGQAAYDLATHRADAPLQHEGSMGVSYDYMLKHARSKIMDKPATKIERNIVSYWELSQAWQAEARSNSDDYEEISYLEPLDDAEPRIHILRDLSECIRVDDPDMDGVIGISNNSAMAVKLSDCGTVAITWFL